jgi:hypothetical protein
MSSPAPAAQRNPTRGYAEIPNSLIENQAILTRAELSLALIVLRRTGPDGSAKISDANWQTWTGLSPRNKKYAAAGLKEKGLAIDGHGDQAVYSFRRAEWDNYVREATREARPRTLGARKAVLPKPGAKVHPDCAESGCAMMCAPERLTLVKFPGGGKIESSPSIATNIVQPVAQTIMQSSEDSVVKTRRIPGGSKIESSPSVATPIVQPVAQTDKDAEKNWPQTLAALRSAFPIVGVAFLGRLLAAVNWSSSGVSDSQLAEAVAIAWQQRRQTQKTEGLFLKTVPEVLAAPPRKTHAKGAPANEVLPHKRAEMEKILREQKARYGRNPLD